MISDTTVTECDGILYDSGGLGQPYDSNEDFTFVIETSGNIELSFIEEFCVETDFDYLYVYDGPNTGSPLLATLTGIDIGLPANIVSSGGVITIQFVSNINVHYCGFAIQWNTTPAPPIPPSIAVNDLPACYSNTIPIDFSTQIGCDWLIDEIIVTANGPIEVQAISPVCNADSAASADLTLSNPIEYNCNYNIQFNLGIPDACDSIWVFVMNTSFLYDQCPIQANTVVYDDSICAAQCTSVQSAVEGCFDHTFVWDNGLPVGPGPHEVCPTEPTTYTVEITELPTGNTLSQSVFVDVVTSEVLLNDTIICQSEEAFNIPATPPGGFWYGNGIQDDETGWFEPDSANVGANMIYYVVSDFCVDSVEITVQPIDAGLTQAACPGSAPFQLPGIPNNGTWSGSPYITPEGIFDPSTAGSYVVYYTIATCVDSTIVNVAEILANTDLGDLCQSEWPDTIDFEPLGGIWSGPGIINPIFGILAPEEMDPGPATLLYEIYGCDQEFDVNILEINTGGANDNSCPEQQPFIPYPGFSPTGGSWSGNGIVDANSGLYDPSLNPNDTWNDLIYTAPNGCQDTIHMFNRQTEILTDTVWFCVGDEELFLEWETVGRTPWGGQWTGNGILNPEGNDFYFSSELAGPGEHWLTYFQNDCLDSMLAIVYPAELSTESISLCSDQEEFQIISSLPSGGMWTGNGITNSELGIFDPDAANPGNFTVYWTTNTSCQDSVEFTVEEFFQAEISGMESIYCFEDITIDVGIFPENAILTGSTTDSTFNPSQAGSISTLYLEYDGGLCQSSDTMTIEVYPEIISILSALDTVLCPGEGTTLNVVSSGGIPNAIFTYSWSNDLFPASFNNVSPEVTTTYYVTTIDGCSDNAIDSVLIEVLPAIGVDIETSDTLCYGTPGWASADVLNSGTYTISWGTNPPLFDEIIEDIAGSSHLLQVYDDNQGCTFDTLVLIPNYSPISASFSVNPNEECIAFEDNPVEFIDLSQYGLSGTWTFGNGVSEPYVPGINPSMTYEQSGDYTITLEIVNEGDCPDSTGLDICILPPTPIFIPDIFSPNDDGFNDFLYVRGKGIVDMQFLVYDRWGQLMFESNDPEVGWDGKHRGQPMPSGVYAYFLRVSTNDGARSEFKGDITLVR